MKMNKTYSLVFVILLFSSLNYIKCAKKKKKANKMFEQLNNVQNEPSIDERRKALDLKMEVTQPKLKPGFQVFRTKCNYFNYILSNIWMGK